MNVVDSSAWLEYFADGPNADFFADAIEATGDLLVPAISLYEVFKRVLQQRGEDAALQAVAISVTVYELRRCRPSGSGRHGQDGLCRCS